MAGKKKAKAEAGQDAGVSQDGAQIELQRTGSGDFAGLNPTSLPTPFTGSSYDPLGGADRPDGFEGVYPEPPRP